MSKFSTKEKKPARTRGDTVNLAGGEAFTQSPKYELVGILTTSFLKDQYYRGGNDTIDRLRQLVEVVDPKFAAKAALFARDEFGMRSVSHVMAGELAHRAHAVATDAAGNKTGAPWTADFFERIVIRTDDMAEVLAYYLSSYGKPLPNSLKKGFRRAFDKLDSYKLSKYRGESKNVSLIDVVNLIHPTPTYKNAQALKDLVEGTLRSTETWESKVSASGKSENKEEAKNQAWSELLFSDNGMPYFALLRNLRNIEQTGDARIIAQAAKQLVEDDPGSHRILPFRFLTAYNEVSNSQLKSAISRALDRACENVPELPGNTLIAIDHSGSMGDGPGSPKFIADSFAAIVAKSNNAEVIVFGSTAGYLPYGINKDDSTLTLSNQISQATFGHATNFPAIFDTANKKYDRIIIFSDMQAWVGYYNPTSNLRTYEQRTGAKPFIYSFDLSGYGTTQFPAERILHLSGVSEKIFDTMAIVEQDPDALINRIEAIDL